MPAFLFQIELPVFSPEMMATVPAHRRVIDKMFSDGRMLSYSVSAKRNMIWCVLNTEDEQDAMDKVVTMPLYPYFIDVCCNPLLFHNTLPSSLPGIVLN